uniref:Talin-1 n=1 Tax=Magallana gigas TaxID=29159 RepID=A0A8W8NU76_MAGGI
MIEKLTKSITKTDEQVMVREGMSFVEYQSNMVSLAKKIAMTTQEMVGKAGVNPGDLRRLANQLTRDYDVLASNSANAAATSNSQDIANRIRTTVQDLGKSCVELVQDAGKVQGDPHDTYARRDLQDHARSVSKKVAFVLAALQSGSRDTQACINAASAAPKHNHDNIDTAADNTMDVVQDLLQSLEEAASQAGVVNSMIEKLTKSITKTDEQVMVREGMSFVEYQSNMVSLAKKIAMMTQEMVGKAGVNPGDLRRLANQLTRDYDVLASNSANAAATSNSQDIANRIRTTVQDLGKSCVELVQDAGKVQGDPHDTYARRDLQDHARSVSEKVAFVLAALQSGSCDTQACINASSAAPKHNHDNIDTAADNTMDVVQDLLQSLEEAASQAGVVNSMIEKLTKSITKTDEQVMVREGMSFVEYQSNMVSLAKKIAMTTQEMIANCIRTTVQDLGKSCVELVQDAGKVQGDPHDTYARRDLQDHARSVSEKVAFVLAALQSGSRDTQACINAASAAPKHNHDNIDTAADNTMDVVQDLLQSLEEAASQAGVVNSMIEKLTKSITETDEQVMVREGMSFVEYQSNMVSLAKKIAMTTQEMVGKAGVNPGDLGRLANQLTRDYDVLASNSANAAATSNSQDIANRIRTTVQDLGKSCVELVQDAGKVQGDPHDTYARRDLQDHARSVSEKVAFVLAALQSGSRDTQACINAASAAPKHNHDNIDTAADNTMDVVQDLLQSLEEAASQAGVVNSMIEKLTKSITKTDEQVMVREGMSFVEHQSNMVSLAKKIVMTTQEMVGKAGVNPGDLRRLANQLTRDYDVLASNSANAAATSNSQDIANRIRTTVQDLGKSCVELVQDAGKVQGDPHDTYARRDLQDHARSVSEKVAFVLAALQSGSRDTQACINAASAAPKHNHDNIDTAADNTMDVVQDLLQSLEEAASQAGVVNSMIEKLTKSITKTDEQVMVREGMSFVEYQSNMVSLAKKIVMTTQEMVDKAGVNPGDLGRLANQLTRDYDVLASNSANAAATSNSQDIANRIRTTVQDLGKSCVELVQDAGKVQGDPHDTYARRDLQDHARSVSEKVAFVLAALQSGSRGTQACINAASAVSGIIADLDTTIMFATAGTLCTEGDDSFASHREDILKTAKALVEETKKLVQGAASDQETLAGAAQQAVKTITKLADVVKLGAASLGSNQPEAQVMTINAVKDVASALSDLISATKNASGKNVSDPAMMTLKEAAKKDRLPDRGFAGRVMVTNVTSLLKTVETVEDEAARGTRALESTIEAIGQEVKSYEAGTLPEKKATAEDLIRLTKPITTATAKAVAAGNSGRQEDVIICANMGRKAIFDLLATCRGTASTAETTEVRQKTIAAGKNCAVVYKDLLEQVSTVVQKPSQEAKQTLAARAHQVAVSVQEIVHCSELIKDDKHIPHEFKIVVDEVKNYSRLDAEKEISVAAGTPCDNYRGYCDVFHRCRGVDNDGPLERLKNLIFGEETRSSIKDWIIIHWWGVLLIAVGAVVVMGVFIKVCSVNTPSENPKHKKIRKQNDKKRGPVKNPGPYYITGKNNPREGKDRPRDYRNTRNVEMGNI